MNEQTKLLFKVVATIILVVRFYMDLNKIMHMESPENGEQLVCFTGVCVMYAALAAGIWIRY